jgi:hypothetical protein
MDRFPTDGVYYWRLDRGNVTGVVANGACRAGTGDGDYLLAWMKLQSQ